jgi:hypothetical protein
MIFFLMTKDECECGLTKFSREQEKNLKQNFGDQNSPSSAVYILYKESGVVFLSFTKITISEALGKTTLQNAQNG